MPNAITLLKEDHDKVKDLLTQLEETTNRGVKTRQELLEKIVMELKVHTKIEEDVFYPAFKAAAGKVDERVMFYEANEEHRLVDFEIPRIQKTDPSTDDFSAHAKVLKELVEHHADEEEKEMFPMAKKLLSKEQLEEIGTLMEEEKKKLMGSAS
jgi:hemerythrin-like domain-containing protein